ncbi:hypothetical protein F5I97DRAFT_647257 [Phlebopus sp. FC_14]|nr:hypothetical protein F5I97DRAFT_647257 [Phlebopus sp. FC_14]
MDSSVTLVNPAPPTAYFLSSSDLKNTTIYVYPSTPIYKITGNSKRIKISDERKPGRTVAVLRRRIFLDDTVCFPERSRGYPTSLGRWLRNSKLSDGRSGYVMTTSYGSFVWKMISRHRQKVYADYDRDKPIASCYLHQNLAPGTPAFILESEAEPLRDDIVVGYLIQRNRVMMVDRALDIFVSFTR